EIAAGARRPVVIADTQDNPGGGGTCDTTGLLHALIAADAQDALVIHINDAVAVHRALDAGVGGTLLGSLGGRIEPEHGAPVDGPFHVEALGDGAFTGEGPMYRGNAIRLGPVALVRKGGVRIIVAERAMQASEPGLPRHLDVDPHSAAILVLKSAVHFRAAYGRAASASLIAKAPGRVAVDLSDLKYRHATRPIAGTSLPRRGAA
ncbi:MAG: MlrC C-terminal domain-containing protein, partial [Pseudomonadota bacterium]